MIQRRRAVAVILSGNGSDGVIALQDVKAAGGVTFAQDELTARYPSMPRAAALDGNADHIMRPRDIASELVRIAGHPYTNEDDKPPLPVTTLDGDPIGEIINLLRVRTSVDFTHYKQTTIRRRILRRMALRNLQDPASYLAQLRSDDDEVQNLYQDFLIRVTQFFRDPEAFEALKEKVFPAIVNSRPAGSVIRIWVAGCSTGEEVYSLAIALLEYLDERMANLTVKILATDLNDTALDKARAGVYLDNIDIDVSPERLRRFFVKHDGHYQIAKAIRELCVFSRHNMTSDPPFSRLDLISCRNVLIYMDSALQQRVIPLLHYALNSTGFLFLGSSENVGSYAELFVVVDSHNRIFARVADGRGVSSRFQLVRYVRHARPSDRQRRRGAALECPRRPEGSRPHSPRPVCSCRSRHRRIDDGPSVSRTDGPLSRTRSRHGQSRPVSHASAKPLD